MRRFLLVGFMAILMVAPELASGQQITQQVRISSSPNPVGSGARAVGMGSAFIAIADDATAASWNPGGLIQLERPELVDRWLLLLEAGRLLIFLTPRGSHETTPSTAPT